MCTTNLQTAAMVGGELYIHSGTEEGNKLENRLSEAKKEAQTDPQTQTNPQSGEVLKIY